MDDRRTERREASGNRIRLTGQLVSLTRARSTNRVLPDPATVRGRSFDLVGAGDRCETLPRVRMGITGHSNLTADSVPLVADGLREALARSAEPLVGVSCLAPGADQVFARVVLERGGELEVVLPAEDYRERKVTRENRADFEFLLGKARRVVTLPYADSNRAAYLAASERVLSSVDALLAVWDGKPADGRGGTGDVVDAARERGLPVTMIWPEGVSRAPR